MKKLLLLVTGTILCCGSLSAQKMYDATHKLPTQSANLKNMLYEGSDSLFHDASMNSVYWGGRETGLAVYVPPQYYTEPNRRFPVLYYMHGQGGGAGLDGADGKMAGEIHKLIEAGTIEPFIFVVPSGGPLQFSGPSEEFVIKEVIPFMDDNYRTYPYPEQRAIMGFSMGGAVSTRLGVVYKELLSSLCLFKSATLADTIGNWDFMRYVYDVHGPRYNDDPNPVLAANGTEDDFEKRWNFQYLKDKYNIDFDTLAVGGCGHNENCYFVNSGAEILTFTTENFVRVIKQSSNNHTLVSEDGTTDSYTLELIQQPTADVVITLNPESGISTDVGSVTFSSANWDTPQEITVSADDNADAGGSRTKKITHSVASTDAYYDGTRVKHEFVTIQDDESPAVLNFAERSKSARPPFYVFSGSFMTRENFSVDQWPPAYNELANYPKDRNILLSVGLENPHPASTIEVTVRLVENKLKQNEAYSPAFADSDDIEGFVDTTITFYPGDTLIEFEIPVTNDDIEEGLEIAQFALGCADGYSNLQIGEHNIASVGISDDESDASTDTNIIISEVYMGSEAGDVAIELFNANYRDLPLGHYHFEIEKSTGGTVTIDYLRAYNDGSIRPGDTWVICGTNAPEHVQKTANYVDARLNNVRGNDVIKFMDGSTVKDVVGVSGSHPAEGEGWTVAGVPNATTRTLIRKFDVNAGVSDFTSELTSTSASSEWVVEEQGYYRNLGIHAYQTGSFTKTEDTEPDDPCAGTSDMEDLFESVQAYEAFIYPNPASEILHIAYDGVCQKISLYNGQGQLIEQSHDQNTMAVQHLIEGQYIVRVTTDEGTSCHQVIISKK